MSNLKKQFKGTRRRNKRRNYRIVKRPTGFIILKRFLFYWWVRHIDEIDLDPSREGCEVYRRWVFDSYREADEFRTRQL